MSGIRPRGLPEYLALVWQKKWFISLITAVVLLAIWTVIRRLPDTYESHALVVVRGTANDETRQAVAGEITLITKKLESRAMLAPLIQRHHLYPEMSPEAQFGQMLKALKIETKLRNYYPELPEAVSLSFRYSDPVIAQRVLADVVNLFAGTNEFTARQAADEARVIDTKIAEIEAQMQRQNVRRPAVRSLLDPRTLRAERLAASATVESLQDKQYALERQIEEQRREVAEQQKLIKAAPPAQQSGATGALLVRKAELEGQLKDYATQYTDKNPKVVQARNQLAEINQQLAQLNQAGSGGIVTGSAEEHELRSLQRDLTRMQTELDVTQRELKRRQESLTKTPVPPSKMMVDAAVTESGQSGRAEATYLQNRYVALLDRRDRLQLALRAPDERGLTPFRVIDPPSLPRAPVGPDRTRLQLLALALALASGLGAAVLVEGPRLMRIRDERDAEYFLGAPVVGLIPETLTPDERGHRRRVQLTRRLLLFVAALVSIPLLAFVLYRLEIIQHFAFR